MFKIFKYRRVTSTNSCARKLALKEKSNFLVVAREQSAGRGQRSRRWYSPPGGLYFSLFIRPAVDIGQFSDFPARVAASLRKTIKKLFQITPRIKKPNDLLFKNKKIAGILVESAVRNRCLRQLVIGIGININNDFHRTPLAGKAGALKEFSRCRVSHREFLHEFSRQFQQDFPALFI